MRQGLTGDQAPACSNSWVDLPEAKQIKFTSETRTLFHRDVQKGLRGEAHQVVAPLRHVRKMNLLCMA